MLTTEETMKSKSITSTCIILSIAVLAFFGFGIIKVGFPKQLNEIGDSIAGLAGALAFIWLAGGLFLQQSELALTREEYQKLRENSDLEQEFAVIKLYTTGLEHNIKVFSEVYDIIQSGISELSDNIPIYYKISLFCEYCLSIDYQNSTQTYKQIQNHASVYSPILKKYYDVYKQLVSCIESSSQRDVLEQSILKNTMYSDIFDAIKKARETANKPRNLVLEPAFAFAV